VKIVVVIEGREAIPVRAIPLLSNWRFMSPDVVAHVLGDTGGTNVSIFGDMQSGRLSDGKVLPMNKDWWAQFPLGDLKALSEKIKASESSPEAGQSEWKKRSLSELPAGVFVWKPSTKNCMKRTGITSSGCSIAPFETRTLMLKLMSRTKM
jgi:hypothetical protein